MFAHSTVYAAVSAEGEVLSAGTTLEKIAAHVRSGQRVLDVGCGGGRLARHLTALGAEVTGIERHPVAAALARQYCVRVVEKDLNDPGLLNADEKFDVIVLADVLEHLVYPDELLNRLVPHLTGAGIALISVPNIAYYKIRWRLLLGSFNYEPSGIMDRSHLRFFTRDTATQLLHDGGLEPVSTEAVYQVPLGRLTRYWSNMHGTVGALAPRVFATQWVFKARAR